MVRQWIGNLVVSSVSSCWSPTSLRLKDPKAAMASHGSPHLNWLVVRKFNSYLVKKRNIKKHFSTEPHNLLNLASFRYNGLVHKKSLDISPAEKMTFKVTWKRAKYNNKPASCYVSRTMKAGPRIALFKLRRFMRANKYRRDLTKAALRRASAILNSQKRTLQVKKTRPKKSD